MCRIAVGCTQRAQPTTIKALPKFSTQSHAQERGSTREIDQLMAFMKLERVSTTMKIINGMYAKYKLRMFCSLGGGEHRAIDRGCTNAIKINTKFGGCNDCHKAEIAEPRGRSSHGFTLCQVSFGNHETEEEAARQYDRALVVEKGRGAKTNFPLTNYEREVEQYICLLTQRWVHCTPCLCSCHECLWTLDSLAENRSRSAHQNDRDAQPGGSHTTKGGSRHFRRGSNV
jgi:hypothetical protein